MRDPPQVNLQGSEGPAWPPKNEIRRLDKTPPSPEQTSESKKGLCFAKGKFTFELSSNAQVSISIYTLGGKKIKQIDNKSYQQGFHQVNWNGRNQFGSLLANGVYIYKIIAKNSTSNTNHIGKIAINR